jgi:hypothetical protein
VGCQNQRRACKSPISRGAHRCDTPQEPARLAVEIDAGPSLELGLGDHDAFDLGFSPLFNSIPVPCTFVTDPAQLALFFVPIESGQIQVSSSVSLQP